MFLRDADGRVIFALGAAGGDVNSTYDGLGKRMVDHVRANASGLATFQEYHTPFGEVENASPANADRAGFTGHIRDRATGLTYMQARYQHPVTGRFLSVDPVEFLADGRTGMVNRYSYTLNDPVLYTDPSGNAAPAACFAIPTCRGLGGALIGGVTGGFAAVFLGGDIKEEMMKGAYVGFNSAAFGPSAGTASAATVGYIDGYAKSDADTSWGRNKDGLVSASLNSLATGLGSYVTIKLGISGPKGEAAANGITIFFQVAPMAGLDGADASAQLSEGLDNVSLSEIGFKSFEDFVDALTGAGDRPSVPSDRCEYYEDRC